MQKSLWRKGLVVGIMILFLGSSVVSSISGDLSKSNIVEKRQDESVNIDAIDNVETREDPFDETRSNSLVKSGNRDEPLLWWNVDWLYRKQITIDHNNIDAVLLNFPVLISNTSLDFVEHAQSDGDDFVFVSANNTMKYNHEIEYYNNSTGKLIAWVNVTSLSSTEDTIIWLYYGNPDCENQENPSGVWDSNYLFVSHMNGTGTTIYDSTSNGNNGTKDGANDPEEVDGKMGKCQDFERSNSENIILDSKIDGLPAITVVAWFKPENMMPTANPHIICTMHGSVGNGDISWRVQLFPGTSEYNLDVWSSGGFIGSIQRDGAELNSWQYYTGVWDGSTFYLYINGSQVGDTTSGSGTMNNDGNPSCKTTIGGLDFTYGDFWDGLIDEVRISSNARSAGWISTTYQNQNNPESFIIVGEERNMIFVDDDFNESTPGWQINHFDTIQDGIDAVSENWIVYVYNGTYYENVDITKNRITLIGEDRNSTIINGSGGNDCILAVYTNNVTIQGFTLEYSIQGIKVVESQDYLIEDCIATDNLRGVYLHVSERVTLKDCYNHNNSEEGILIVNCDNSEISNCDVADNNGTGLRLEQHYTGICTDNLIYHNNLINNTINAFDDNEDVSNLWYLFYGNYYDDYVGEDSDGNGIGDTPYDISGGSSQDLYPLIDPWGLVPSLDVVYVNDDFNELTVGWGYNRFDNIREGINAVWENGSVLVYSGTYTEDLGPDLEYVRIEKSLNLIGENRDSTIINCPSGDTGVWFTPGTRYVNVSGFTVIGANNSATIGIYPQIGSNNIRIENCITHGFGEGISIRHLSSNITIRNCISYNNSRRGGITFLEWDYENIEVSDCLCHSNTLYGIHVSNANGNNFVFGNTITGSSDVGIMIDNSINCIISDNLITNNYDGIRFDSSYNNILNNNTIIENDNDGLWLGSSVENTISHNNISSNDEDNIQIGGGSNENIITNNNISSSVSGLGIIVTGDDNQIYHNNLINNPLNAGDDGYGNTWDDGYPSGGNYWSDFDESGEGAWDNNTDGIVDTPYTVLGTADSQDLYPLINPWNGTSPVPSLHIVYIDNNYTASTPGWEYNHFDSIQDGIDAVLEDGIVHVFNGTYYENVVINKTINLIGENRNSTFIDGGGIGDVVQITADLVNISGFSMINSGSSTWNDAGLDISHSSDCMVENCLFFNNLFAGIRLDSVSNCQIFNCESYDNGHNGIYTRSSSDVQIMDCIVYNNNGNGMRIEQSSNNFIIANCTISNNGEGIQLLQSANNNIIVNCSSFNNSANGIQLHESANNNLVYHCNLFNNTQNVFCDNSSNCWYNATLEEGNYYDDYTGVDLDLDGIGDTPYNISGGSNQDNYPFMEQYGWELDYISPEITSVTLTTSDPLDTEPCFGWENFTCTVTDNVAVDEVKLVLTGDTTAEYPMIKDGDDYYCNMTISTADEYTYHIWADDTSDNYAESPSDTFPLPLNEDVNEDGSVGFVDIMMVAGMWGQEW